MGAGKAYRQTPEQAKACTETVKVACIRITYATAMALIVTTLGLFFGAWVFRGDPRDRHWVVLHIRILASCVMLDLVGGASLLVPFPFSYLADLGYAPIYAAFTYRLFGSPWLAIVGFLKEITPLVNILPFCCILWLLQTFCRGRGLARWLGLADPVERRGAPLLSKR